MFFKLINERNEVLRSHWSFL